jgi:hypothetical protein
MMVTDGLICALMAERHQHQPTATGSCMLTPDHNPDDVSLPNM